MAYYQGYFRCKNPNKYKGNPTEIVYRSSWELKYMMQLDSDPDVLEWSSEEAFVPYISPKDNRPHRYFYDFLVKKKTKDGIKIFMIEVKPHKETLPPTKAKRVTKKFINEVQTYAVNQAKWNSAKAYCKIKGWEFVVLTEKELKI